MMALLYEFPVPRPKVDKLSAIDLKRKGPSSCPKINDPQDAMGRSLHEDDFSAVCLRIFDLSPRTIGSWWLVDYFGILCVNPINHGNSVKSRQSQ
jgi:hypothetical protein